MGMIWSLRHYGTVDTAYTSMDDFKTKKWAEKKYQKRGFDYKRLEFLQRELEKTEK